MKMNIKTFAISIQTLVWLSVIGAVMALIIDMSVITPEEQVRIDEWQNRPRDYKTTPHQVAPNVVSFSQYNFAHDLSLYMNRHPALEIVSQEASGANMGNHGHVMVVFREKS